MIALPITKRFPCLGESWSHFSVWVIYIAHILWKTMYILLLSLYLKLIDIHSLFLQTGQTDQKKHSKWPFGFRGSSAFFWEFACRMYSSFYIVYLCIIYNFFYLCSPYALHAKTNYLIVSCIESNGLDKSKLTFFYFDGIHQNTLLCKNNFITVEVCTQVLQHARFHNHNQWSGW